MRWRSALFLIIAPLFGQNRCELPDPKITPPGTTLFSPSQEGYLGEFLHETLRRGISVYDMPELAAPLDRIAQRLLRYLPPTEYKFQFTLIELPTVNAFAISGGRIFVARKLIAFVQSEDELAGVLAHEMGHVLARQQSVDISKTLRDTLKITSLGDRADVFRRMNQLMDMPVKSSRSRGEDDQIEADRISFEAVLRAGYKPEALPEFFDRMSNNQGRTGNFLTDMFGATSPTARRYREMLREIGSIPPSCREERQAVEDAEFGAWKQRVTDLTPEDMLSALPDRRPSFDLPTKMRPDVHTIRFSRDGKLLFAQDESGITVMRPEPLSVLFRIPAMGAGPAIFQADGSRILFTSSGRVEVWNLETRAREHRWEPNFSFPCPAPILSPDGHSAACVTSGGTSIRLVDIPAEKEIASKQIMVRASVELLLYVLSHSSVGTFGFSPDGSAFLASYAFTDQSPWAFDMAARKDLSIGNPLKGALHSGFAFLDGARIAAVHAEDSRKSGVFSWPAGKELQKLTIPTESIKATTNGDTLLLTPFRTYAFGAMGIDDQIIYMASPKAAFDRSGNISAAERTTGEIGLYAGRTTQASAATLLPDALLATPRGGAHSPDLNWLALSVRGRSQLWNLQTGQTYLMGAFDGGFISANNIFTATQEQSVRDEQGRPSGNAPHRVSMNVQNQGLISSERIEKKGDRVRLFAGRYELSYELNPKETKVFAQVRDTIDLKTLWSREFDADSRLHFGNTLVLQYPAKSRPAEAILKAKPALKAQLADMPKPEQAFVLDVIRLENGEPLGSMVVEAIDISDVTVAGRNLFIEDDNNRTLVYSLDGAGRNGQQFGRVVATDPVRGLVATSNRLGAIAVFDSAMLPVAEFVYPANTIYAGFDGAGKRLLVVTGQQEVFIENLP